MTHVRRRTKFHHLRKIPDEIYAALSLVDDPVSPEENLWRNVILRRILDSLGYTGETAKDIHDKAVEDAREWFRSGEDIQDVFDAAGMPYNERIRGVVLSIAPIVKKQLK